MAGPLPGHASTARERFRCEAGAVLLDIEGTIAPVSFVRDVLFPYARSRLAAFVAARRDHPMVVASLVEAAALADGGAPLAALQRWHDEDAKIPPLKRLQGLIWEEGYRSGAFRSPLFPDAHDALRQWTADGLPLYVYSSGSLQAQDLYFAHSEAGDLRPLFSGHYDTGTGPKTSPASYARIAEEIAVRPAGIVFLSDNANELQAAHGAGLQAVQVIKDGTPPAPGFPQITDFGDIEIVRAPR